MSRPLTYPAVRATAKALDVLLTDSPQGGFYLRLRYPGSPVHYVSTLALALDTALALASWDSACLGEGEGA